MSHKEYNSAEYFAQEFAKCVRGEGNYSHRQGITGWKARHTGAGVHLWVMNQEYYVMFKTAEGKKPIAELEAVLGSEDYRHLGEFDLEFDRSAEGRISPPSYTDFFEKIIFPKVKADLKSRQ